MKDISEALAAVDSTYEELASKAEEILSMYIAEPNKIIEEARNNSSNPSNDYIRELIWRLALSSYGFSEIRDKAYLKKSCAEVIKDVNYSCELSKAEGTVAQKQSTATLNNVESILVEALYEMVANSLKTKLDEIHRVVDSLKNILISRQSEAKLAFNAECGTPIE